jgi:DNA-binding winged helix-turn-helix (wHTH) protein
MSARCPHCSGNIAEGAAVTRGEWWVGPAIVYRDGEQIALPRYLARVLYAIAYANGEPVSHHDIPGITAATLNNHVAALRRLFGDRTPIVAVARKGYAWDVRA